MGARASRYLQGGGCHLRNNGSAGPATQGKVCIITLDPLHYGGIFSMMSFVYRCLEQNGYDPYLVYNSIDPDDHLSLIKLLRGKSVRTYEEKVSEGLKGISLGINFVELEFLHYLSARKRWKKALADADYYMAIGGTNQCCLPYVLGKKTFYCWVATTYMAERQARLEDIKKYPLPKRLIRFLSLPVITCLERLIFRRAHWIYAMSEHTASNIKRIRGVDRKKVFVVPFPIDTKKFFPLKRRTQKERYLLLVARVNDSRKNAVMLLSSFSSVVKEFPDVKLVIIGDAPETQYVEKCDDLGITQSVKFLERMPNAQTIEYYQNASIFTLSSFQEGLGIVVLEAMACGVPVVSTRCGGPEQVVIDGVTGFLVENNNQHQFTEAILKLLRDEPLQRRMGENAAKHVQDNFSVEKIGPRFVEGVIEVGSIVNSSAS
jgi:glycosyltransferase involved in cell wall biosynthesis